MEVNPDENRERFHDGDGGWGSTSHAEAGPRAGVSHGNDCMHETGKRRSGGKAAWELRKLRAETEIAERQLAEMPMRRLLDMVAGGLPREDGGGNPPESNELR